MESPVAALCNKFKKQVSQGQFFWRTKPPRSYMRGMLYSGINFCILGLDELNEFDERWLTEGDLSVQNYLALKPQQEEKRILVYIDGNADQTTGEISDNTQNISVFSTSAYNVLQLNDKVPEKNLQLRQLDLSIMLPESKIPYRTANGVTYFSARKQLAEINEEDLAVEPLKFLRHICQLVLQKMHLNDKDAPKPGSKFSYFDQLTIEIASCRIAHTLACATPMDEYIRQFMQMTSKVNFNSPEMQMYFLKAFADATTIERSLLTQNEFDEPDESMPDFMRDLISPDEWSDIVSNANSGAFSLIVEDLKQSCLQCSNARNSNIAYLRYIADATDDRSLEFYATSLTDEGNIVGLFKTENELIPIQLEKESLFANFNVDITFSPCKVNELEQQ